VGARLLALHANFCALNGEQGWQLTSRCTWCVQVQVSLEFPQADGLNQVRCAQSPQSLREYGDMALVPASEGDALRIRLLAGLPEKRGVLKKLGGLSLGIEALKSLQDRWVELRGPVLEYYSSARDAQLAERKPRGAYVLDGAVVEPARHDRMDSPFVFVLRTGQAAAEASLAGLGAAKREEYFAAPSQEEFDGWLAALRAVVAVLHDNPAPAPLE
jgi:hypothetical protein